MKLTRTPDTMLFVVKSLTGKQSERAKIRKAVSALLGKDARGRAWRLEPLFPPEKGQTAELKRYFRVSGSVDAPAQQWDQVAFEIAYRLRDAIGYAVHPDLPSSHFASPTAPSIPPEEADDDTPQLASGFGTPGAHLPGSQPFTWALDTIRAPQAWGLPPSPGGASQGEGIVVAHPDTGYTNPPNANIAAFDLTRDRDIIDNDDDAHDPLEQTPIVALFQPGHGTSSASVIAGQMLPNIQGAAPKAKIVPLRAQKSVWHVFDSDVARAVNYARQIGAHVISMSLGGTWFSGLEDAINSAVAEGIIVMAAAGNHVGFVVAPASYRTCIAVTAINANELAWEGASRGSKVAVSAPGESVWAAEYFFEQGGPRLGIARQTGTTFAVALTAGVAALWLAHHGRNALIQKYGKAGLQAAFSHMLRTVGHRRPPGWDTSNMGVGIVDAQALLSSPLPNAASVPSLFGPGLTADADGQNVPESIAALFPQLSKKEIRQRLETLLKAKGQALNARIERHEVELVRMFTERRASWEAFLSMMSQVGDQPVLTADAAGLGSSTLITQYASPTLISAMNRA